MPERVGRDAGVSAGGSSAVRVSGRSSYSQTARPAQSSPVRTCLLKDEERSSSRFLVRREHAACSLAFAQTGVQML